MKMQDFRNNLLALFLLTLSAGQYVWAADPVVTINSGAVRGVKLLSTSKREFYAFRGIPYAEPPVGPLRFKDPVPVAPWTGEFDATKDSDRCAGVDRGIISMSGTEDCLKINVYTPKLPAGSNPSLPVFVWIYGGGFTGGTASSEMYGPQRFMNKDMVLVIPYYRVGPLGFLNTLDSAAPGNAGLQDQHLALLWVQQNIAAFGGDPTKVTLGGESAGGASVSYHMLSPLSEGLFRSVIMESGNAMGPWAHEEFPLLKARELGLSVGCLQIDTTELVKCLQSKPVDDIVLTPIKIIGAARSFLGFVPSVEKRSSGAIVVDKPEKLYREGRFRKVPVLTGVNADETMLVFAAIKNKLLDVADNWVFNVTFPECLSQFTKEDLTTALANISPTSPLPNYFLNLNVLFPAYIFLESITDIMSDVFFNAPNDKLVRLLGRHGVPVYMYVLDYKGDAAPTVAGVKVAIHALDLEYLFYMFDLTSRDQKLSDELVRMWYNFIAKSDPTPGIFTIPKWKRAYPTVYPDYLYIGQGILGNHYFDMRHLGYRTSEAFFWNEIFPPFTLP